MARKTERQKNANDNVARLSAKRLSAARKTERQKLIDAYTTKIEALELKSVGQIQTIGERNGTIQNLRGQIESYEQRSVLMREDIRQLKDSLATEREHADFSESDADRLSAEVKALFKVIERIVVVKGRDSAT